MALKNAIAVFLTSLMALPMSYTLNSVAYYGKDRRLIFLAGSLCLILITVFPQIVLRKGGRPQRLDSFFHVMSLLTYSSILSLITALENDGLIAEFLGFFLRDGAPYMKTAYGTMISYWDGIGHNALYMMMMAAVTWNQSFYDVGLYWVGSFGHRLLVLVVSVAIGSDGLGWVFMMQIPFMAICLWAGFKFSQEKILEVCTMQEEQDKSDASSKNCLPIWKRPHDLLLLLFYCFAGCFTFFRFICVLGGNNALAKHYVEKIEPYLSDPQPFSKAEIMVQTFYFIPYYCVSIIGLLVPGESWVPRYALIFAGAAGQGQFAYMGSSFHYRTPYIYRVPQTLNARSTFWLFNSLLFLVPQYAAYAYNAEPQYFLIKPHLEKADQPQNSNGKLPTESVNSKKVE